MAADESSGPSRTTTLVRPRVLTIPTRNEQVTMRFAQPGTVALLIAGAEGRDTLDAIAAAVDQENLGEVDRIFDEIKVQFARMLVETDGPTLTAQHERMHATFVHDRRRLVLGMFVPQGVSVAHSLALLDTDVIDPTGYTVAVSRADGVTDDVFALAVARPAELTPLEREVLLRIPAEMGRAPGVEVGFFTEGIIARAAADIGQRAIDWVANEIGIADQIHQIQDIVGQVEHAARDVVGAAVDAADDVIHGLAEAVGIEDVIAAGQEVVAAIDNIMNVVDNAVNAIVDGVVDAALDFVANAGDDVVGAAEHAAEQVAGAAVNAVEGVADAVGGAVNAVGHAVDAVGNAVAGAADVVGQGADAVGHAVADAAGAVVDAAAGAVNAAADAVGQAADAVGHAVDVAVDAVGDAVGAAVDWVADHVFGGVDPDFRTQFEIAAAAQLTFQRSFERQIDVSVDRLEIVRPAASLQQLVEARTQLVRQAGATRRVGRVSILSR